LQGVVLFVPLGDAGVADRYDNAMAEGFFRRRFATQTKARMVCFSDIEG